MSEYLNKKLREANCFIKETIGLKSIYLEKDIFTILTKYGWVENLDFYQVPLYLPRLGYDFESIDKFTKGFIDGENYQIYGIRMGNHYNIFVIDFNEYGEFNRYYSVTISEETLGICYVLEAMLLNKNNI